MAVWFLLSWPLLLGEKKRHDDRVRETKYTSAGVLSSFSYRDLFSYQSNIAIDNVIEYFFWQLLTFVAACLSFLSSECVSVYTRKGYVALATHGRVALILRMNGSDRMWCKVLMFQPIYHVSVSPTDGNGPTQGQRKTLTRVEFVFLFVCFHWPV